MNNQNQSLRERMLDAQMNGHFPDREGIADAIIELVKEWVKENRPDSKFGERKPIYTAGGNKPSNIEEWFRDGEYYATRAFESNLLHSLEESK